MVNEVKKRDKIIITTECTKTLSFLYHTIIGRLFLKVLTLRIVSKVIGWLLNSHLSTLMIKNFIKKNNIDMNRYEKKKYKSYNDFFTRQLKESYYHFEKNSNILISPCDAKLTAYRIDTNSYFTIKGTNYRIEDLLKNRELAQKYQNGYCLIYRLTVDDYHRYCYIDDGYQTQNIYLQGVLHTVQPISFEYYNVYKENCREYTILQTKNFGDVIQVEVGAMCIGYINNHHENYKFQKGEEKGLFEFGGSTIVLLFEEDAVNIDQEIIDNTTNGYETIVKIGKRVGVKKC